MLSVVNVLLICCPRYSCCCRCPVQPCFLSSVFPVLFSSSKNFLTLMTMFLDWKVKCIPCRPSLLATFVDWMDSAGSGCPHLTYKNNYIHSCIMLHCSCTVHPSFYTKHASALPWRKCVLHYLYAEDLPQLVWIGLTTKK